MRGWRIISGFLIGGALTTPIRAARADEPASDPSMRSAGIVTLAAGGALLAYGAVGTTLGFKDAARDGLIPGLAYSGLASLGLGLGLGALGGSLYAVGARPATADPRATLLWGRVATLGGALFAGTGFTLLGVGLAQNRGPLIAAGAAAGELGLVGIAGGIPLWVGSSSPATAPTVSVGPGSIDVRLRF